MLKKEWPLLAPDDEAVARLAARTRDICEYVVDIAGKEGLANGLRPLEGGVAVHLACHARAQNIGPKAVEMLRLIPDSDIEVIERCSGHGGSWGVKTRYFETALKVGRPAARKALAAGKAWLVSECPLAGGPSRSGDGAAFRLAAGGGARASPRRIAGARLWIGGCVMPQPPLTSRRRDDDGGLCEGAPRKNAVRSRRCAACAVWKWARTPP